MDTRDRFVIIEDVSFNFGEQVILNHINLSLSKGTSYALIGKSGVGKSTLLNLVAGFLKPFSGRILIDNHEVKSQRRNTAFLLQDLGLFPWQTIDRAIAMPLELQQGRKDTGIREQVMTILEELGLEDKKDKYPKELSGGERQRVALARTLISKPDLLLMDEPTSSLDSMTKESIQQLILRYHQRLDTTMLFVTHDIEEAVLLGRKILLLNPDGSISVLDNESFAAEKAREQLDFYEKCIQIRKLLKMGSDDDEAYQ